MKIFISVVWNHVLLKYKLFYQENFVRMLPRNVSNLYLLIIIYLFKLNGPLWTKALKVKNSFTQPTNLPLGDADNEGYMSLGYKFWSFLSPIYESPMIIFQWIINYLSNHPLLTFRISDTILILKKAKLEAKCI